MDKHNGTREFLQAVFREHERHAIFANLNPPFHTRNFTELDPNRDCYWSIAAFGPEAKSNLGDDALHTVALVIDDVGTKGPSESAVMLALGKPTAKVITSAGNFQWSYRLSKPVAINDWNGFFGGIEKLIGHVRRLEAPAAQTLMRLPMGINTKGPNAKGKMKPGHGGTFKVRLVELNPDVEIDPDTIPRVHDKITGGSRGDGGKPCHSYRDIVGLMALIPNRDVHYDDWFAHAERAVAAAVDRDAAREGFETWSAKSVKHDPDEIELRWHSVHPTKTSGKELLAEAEAADPEGYRTWLAREGGEAFDDGDVPPGPPEPARAGITATPFKWRAPDKIPPRDWLYGDILIRKFISMTVAPGGVGKSSLIAVETLAQVTGRNLLGEKPSGELRVWLWNLEDPGEETERKIHAAALHYGISEADMGGRLFVDSGRDQRLVVAVTERNAPTIIRPVIRALVEQIRLRGIDVVVVDPFVSCHEVPENDNTAQDMVVKEWGRVAEEGGCAVHLVDHTRKANGAEVTTESSRGGKAKTDAARVVRVINRLTDAQNRLWMVAAPWRYFSTFNDKANMAPPLDKQDWFYLESVGLGNGTTAAAVFGGGVNAGVVHGDNVGVVTRWVPPSTAAIITGDNFKKMVAEMGQEEWRKAPQAKEKWIGIPAARALELDVTQLPQMRQLKEVLAKWFQTGLLKEVPQLDEFRKEKKIIKVAGGF